MISIAQKNLYKDKLYDKIIQFYLKVTVVSDPEENTAFESLSGIRNSGKSISFPTCTVLKML